jgi:mono/diheme cytochrome c family protein
MSRRVTLFMAALVGAIFLVLTGLMFGEHSAYALPEYAQRTNESCSTCHVNPGGGGPRTMRGLIWAANGKPDVVPELPGVLLAPGVSDGAELYQIACASCHGVYGEGKVGSRLESGGVQENKIRSTILHGRRISGMPSFDRQFTDEQFEALVAYVVALENGQAEPILDTYPLEPPQLQGIPQSTPTSPEGN